MFNEQLYNVKDASSSHRAGSSGRILHKLKDLYFKCDQKQEANYPFLADLHHDIHFFLLSSYLLL